MTQGIGNSVDDGRWAKHRRGWLNRLLLAAALWGSTAHAQDGAEEPRRAPAVTLGVIELRADVRTHTAIGTARAWQNALIRPDAEGRIVEVFVASGARVEPGQKLLMLDTDRETLAVEHAKVRLRAAQLDFDRYATLKQRGAAPETQRERAEIALKSARIGLRESELALARRFVHAPFGGVLGMIDLHPGAHVTTATDIVRLDDRTALLVDFSMPEAAAGSAQVGDVITVSPGGGRTHYKARIETVAQHVDPSTRTFAVRARLENPPPALMPGMSFKVTIERRGNHYPVVPEVAILWGSRGAYVWSVSNGSAQRVPITVVRRHAGEVWIEAALDAGAVVVTEGVQKVREGDRMDVSGLRSPALPQAGTRERAVSDG